MADKGPREELNEILVVLHQLNRELDRVEAELEAIFEERSRLAMKGLGFASLYRRSPEHGADLGETVEAAHKRALKQEVALHALLDEYNDLFVKVFSAATQPES